MKRSKGFTLIELLVVIAIIGLLASIVVVGVNKARERGADAKAKGDIANLRTALQLYFDGIDPPAYPSAAACSAGVTGWTGTPSVCPTALETAGYVSKVPSAPSAPGATYTYTYTNPSSATFTLKSTKNGTTDLISCNEIGC